MKTDFQKTSQPRTSSLIIEFYSLQSNKKSTFETVKSSSGKSSTNNCELSGSNMKAATFRTMLKVTFTSSTLLTALIDEKKG